MNIMLEERINTVLDAIQCAFSEVTLGSGVSWREADIIDTFGTNEARAKARNTDEKLDWSMISDKQIDNCRWQAILCFMDAEGLRFHLPACMCFVLRHYRDSKSIIVDSTIYTLCNGHMLQELKELLTPSQCNSIREFLCICLEISEDWLEISGVPNALAREWAYSKKKKSKI